MSAINFINHADGLEGKIILVTGATSGIGEASARKLASCGANVILTGRNIDKGRNLVAELIELNLSAQFIPADLASFADMDQLFLEIERDYPRLDAAFNCAGIIGLDSILRGKHFHESSFENWQQVINVNMTGLWYCLKQQLKLMYQHKAGVILNCSSVAGLRSSDSRSASYTASKHAVLGLTRALAAEYAPYNIRVNAICPGVVDTPILDGVRDKLLEELKAKNAGAKIGTSDEIAEVVAFMLSERSSYMNGTHLTLDAGGLTGAI